MYSRELVELDFGPKQQMTANLSPLPEKQFKRASPSGGGSIVSHGETGQMISDGVEPACAVFKLLARSSVLCVSTLAYHGNNQV